MPNAETDLPRHPPLSTLLGLVFEMVGIVRLVRIARRGNDVCIRRGDFRKATEGFLSLLEAMEQSQVVTHHDDGRDVPERLAPAVCQLIDRE